jgi:hypothetical protein
VDKRPVCFLNGRCVQQIRYPHNNVKEDCNSNKPHFYVPLSRTGSYQAVHTLQEKAEQAGGTIVCRDLFSF